MKKLHSSILGAAAAAVLTAGAGLACECELHDSPATENATPSTVIKPAAIKPRTTFLSFITICSLSRLCVVHRAPKARTDKPGPREATC